MSEAPRNNKRCGLIVGCNYDNDVAPIVKYLTNKSGWSADDIIVLCDDVGAKPIEKNILRAFSALIEFAKKFENAQILFCYNSRGFTPVDNMICTADEKGISDTTFYFRLIKKLPTDTNVFFIIDSCHTETFGDLPFILRQVDNKWKIAENVRMTTSSNILCMSTYSNKGVETFLKAMSLATSTTPSSQIFSNVVSECEDTIFTSSMRINPEESFNQLKFSFILPRQYQEEIAPVEIRKTPWHKKVLNKLF